MVGLGTPDWRGTLGLSAGEGTSELLARTECRVRTEVRGRRVSRGYLETRGRTGTLASLASRAPEANLAVRVQQVGQESLDTRELLAWSVPRVPEGRLVMRVPQVLLDLLASLSRKD